MNQKIRSLLAIAVAAGLPLAVAAQSGSSGSSAGSTSGSSTSGSTSGQSSTSRSGTSMSGNQNQHSTGSLSSSGAKHGSIQRVTKDSLDRQLTAKGLIGKDVYDRQGEKVGEVQDVVLDSSRAPQLATAFSNRQSTSGGMNNASATGGQRSMTASSSATGASGTAGTGSTYAGTTTDRPSTSTSGSPSVDAMRSATAGLSDAAGQLGSALQSGMDGAAAIISSGGLFSRNELVRVPLSQLSYDAGEDRITIAISRNEFSSLSEPSDTSRSAAE